MNSTTSVRAAAEDLRRCQRAYMADRGNEALGKAVGAAGERLDVALAATELATGDVNIAAAAFGATMGRVEAPPGVFFPSPAHLTGGARAALDAVNYGELRAAATRIYMAGKWSCARPVNEARLFEDLRDALGLKPGTATRAGIHADEPPLPFAEVAP